MKTRHSITLDNSTHNIQFEDNIKKEPIEHSDMAVKLEPQFVHEPMIKIEEPNES